MMKLMKYSGYYLVATGIFHSLMGTYYGWQPLVNMHNDHWFSSIFINDKPIFDRLAIVWFLIAGVMMIILGLFLQKALKEGFIPPISLAWGLIIIGIVLVFLSPFESAYLLLAQGFILLFGIPELINQKIEKSMQESN